MSKKNKLTKKQKIKGLTGVIRAVIDSMHSMHEASEKSNKKEIPSKLFRQMLKELHDNLRNGNNLVFEGTQSEVEEFLQGAKDMAERNQKAVDEHCDCPNCNPVKGKSKMTKISIDELPDAVREELSKFIDKLEKK